MHTSHKPLRLYKRKSRCACTLYVCTYIHSQLDIRIGLEVSYIQADICPSMCVCMYIYIYIYMWKQGDAYVCPFH